MVEKLHNGPWPARMALREKLQPLGVEILVRHLPWAVQRVALTNTVVIELPRHTGVSLPEASTQNPCAARVKPYVDRGSDGWDKAIEIIHFGLNESCQEYARILKQQFIL